MREDGKFNVYYLLPLVDKNIPEIAMFIKKEIYSRNLLNKLRSVLK